MNAPENFRITDGYACVRLTGQVSLQQVTQMITEALAFASTHKIKRLLVDTTRLSGFERPGTLDRFNMVEQWANTSNGVKLAIVARPEMIDPERFGITVASNRGLLGNIFPSEREAVAWLVSSSIRVIAD